LPLPFSLFDLGSLLAIRLRFRGSGEIDGCYLLRTNLQDVPADKLWKMYMGLTTVEESFRIAKSDFRTQTYFPSEGRPNKSAYPHLLSRSCYVEDS
jgi:hypothetical protein